MRETGKDLTTQREADLEVSLREMDATPRTTLHELRKELYALSLDPHVHEERKAAYAVVVCRIDEMLAGAIQPRTPLRDEFPPKTSLRFITCTRERTRGNVYDYDYWKCAHCGWHPGDSDGPPNEFCGNCQRAQYTDNPKEAAHLIRIIKTDCGFGFEMMRAELRAATRQPRTAEEIYSCADTIFKRLYRLSSGKEFPEGEIVSPAAQGIIAQELRRLAHTQGED